MLINSDNSERHLVAYYEKRRKWVKLYEWQFKKLGIPYMLGRFQEVFEENSPFAKVIIDHSRQEHARLSRRLGVGERDYGTMPYSPFTETSEEYDDSPEF